MAIYYSYYIIFYFTDLQISQSSSSPYLSTVPEFPKFIRTVSSDVEAATGVSNIMKHFSWSRVALLTQSETIFTSVSGKLVILYSQVFIVFYRV